MIDTVSLEAAVRRAERLMNLKEQSSDPRFQPHLQEVPDSRMHMDYDQRQGFIQESERRAALQSLMQTAEAAPTPHLFFDDTYNLKAAERAQAVDALLRPVRKVGMLAAGYLEAAATGSARIDTLGEARYCPYTVAQFSVTVRDPDGTGSGWAGVDWNEWRRVDADALAEIALDKCLRSRNPRAVEPGRYTVILEPQAAFQFCYPLFLDNNRELAENGHGPFSRPDGSSQLGHRMFDERITVSADPMDPDLGFVPFASDMGTVYHPVTWIERGVVKELSYFRPYAIKTLGKNTGLPNSGAFRVAGGETSVEEMIATTKRGIYITRFFQIQEFRGAGNDNKGFLLTGYTRDGTWLIENGKISKPTKNFRFVDSPLAKLNQLDQLGPAKRVWNPLQYYHVAGMPWRHFRGGQPQIWPFMKMRDFNLAALSEAV
jgi:hypothetical protein